MGSYVSLTFSVDLYGQKQLEERQKKNWKQNWKKYLRLPNHFLSFRLMESLRILESSSRTIKFTWSQSRLAIIGTSNKNIFSNLWFQVLLWPMQKALGKINQTTAHIIYFHFLQQLGWEQHFTIETQARWNHRDIKNLYSSDLWAFMQHFIPSQCFLGLYVSRTNLSFYPPCIHQCSNGPEI